MIAETISSWKGTKENISKKNSQCFLVQSSGFQHFRHQKPKLMAIFSRNHSLKLYLHKFLDPCDLLPFFLLSVFQKKSLLLREGLQNILYSDNILPFYMWAYFYLLRRALDKAFFCPLGKKRAFILCVPILSHFWCSVVTSVTLIKNLSNFEKNLKKIWNVPKI